MLQSQTRQRSQFESSGLNRRVLKQDAKTGVPQRRGDCGLLLAVLVSHFVESTGAAGLPA